MGEGAAPTSPLPWREKLKLKAKVIVFTITLLVLVLSQAHAQRTIQFAGRTWFVKSGYGGPGPNYWSDSTQSVWIDGNGALHLKIRNISGTWYCSEVWTQGTTRYGMHRFYTISQLDSLDRNVVAAPFLYANDTTEIDIEFSKWGWANPYNGWYVVQPPIRPTNLDSFTVRLTGTYTTHYINWQRDSIRFKSIHGHRQDDSLGYYRIRQWLYQGSDNPRVAESLRVHINLWLFQGRPPSNGLETEMIVSRADLPSGVEREDGVGITSPKFIIRCNPNPFSSFTTLPGYESECFVFYDISGRQVGTSRGDRIGLGLSPGVYFLKGEGKEDRPLRIVKVR